MCAGTCSSSLDLCTVTLPRVAYAATLARRAQHEQRHVVHTYAVPQKRTGLACYLSSSHHIVSTAAAHAGITASGSITGGPCFRTQFGYPTYVQLDSVILLRAVTLSYTCIFAVGLRAGVQKVSQLFELPKKPGIRQKRL